MYTGPMHADREKSFSPGRQNTILGGFGFWEKSNKVQPDSKEGDWKWRRRRYRKNSK